MGFLSCTVLGLKRVARFIFYATKKRSRIVASFSFSIKAFYNCYYRAKQDTCHSPEHAGKSPVIAPQTISDKDCGCYKPVHGCDWSYDTLVVANYQPAPFNLSTGGCKKGSVTGTPLLISILFLYILNCNTFRSALCHKCCSKL